MQKKQVWAKVDGVLLLDKAEGLTSNSALQKARRLFNAARAGHTGTLDPLATGLLPVCFGEATKFSADLLEADKSYEAEVHLGVTTRTGDREGQTTATAPVTCARADIEAALPRFTGDLLQVPPMYSALKKDGRALYTLARQGREVERAPRPVTIHALELLAWQTPVFTLRVRCSKGTYIRVLAEDLGKTLGCGAHLSALRRTRVGALDLDNAHTLAELEALAASADQGALSACLLPPDSLLSSLPALHLTDAAALRFTNGNPVSAPPDIQGEARVYGQAGLLGVGMVKADGLLWPKRIRVQRTED
ncbi:MAG: tRNA pseudouridine(55) synthase TruB [Zoogloeaceae bacterium]|jgi:tRNA pseudouridine55 synthase|nr:tRNA pseudouridine(55) synthase TruB [Zoogloeaceae bacterium]